MRAVLPMLRSESSPALGIAKLFVLHSEAELAIRIGEFSRQLNAQFVTLHGVGEFLARADETSWGCVVIDYAAFREDLLRQIHSPLKQLPGLAWVVSSPELPTALAVEAMKWGATDVALSEADLAAILPAAIEVGRERFFQSIEQRMATKRFAQLTPSERVVLSLVIQGRTNKEVALRLGRGVRTVESRRQRVLHAMHAENAVHLAVLLARHGLIEQSLAGELEFHEAIDAASA